MEGVNNLLTGTAPLCFSRKASSPSAPGCSPSNTIMSRKFCLMKVKLGEHVRILIFSVQSNQMTFLCCHIKYRFKVK